MPEIRQNMATKEWVIIATERARRPDEFIQPDKDKLKDCPAFVAHCPFCPGNEELDLERLRLPMEGDWLLRVVANKYPALRQSGELVQNVDGVNCSMLGIGYHEVVVESRLHNTCPALQPAEDLERTLNAFQLRGRMLQEDRRIEHIIYFKNHGLMAGTSLRHPHAQLVALPIVPYSVRMRMDEARRFFDDQGACVLCQMRQEEAREQTRLVVESTWFSAFIPYAAYSPFHLWIIPRRHTASFLDASSEEVRDLSLVLHEVLRKLYVGLNDPDYNYIIRSAPRHKDGADYLHWYIAIVPRVSHMAGFEMGSGMFINTAMPEDSAQFLRSVTPP